MRAGKGAAGSASVEIVLLTPLFLVLVAAAFYTGRLVLARQVVEDAAGSALEAAITMPDARQAVVTAKSTAHEVLDSDGLCSMVQVSEDTSEFRAGGSLTLRVSCVVRGPSLSLLRLPGAVTLTATRSGALEPYREIRS